MLYNLNTLKKLSQSQIEEDLALPQHVESFTSGNRMAFVDLANWIIKRNGLTQKVLGWRYGRSMNLSSKTADGNGAINAKLEHQFFIDVVSGRFTFPA